MAHIIITTLLFAAIIIYFKVAVKYNIIDKPNQRSSHTSLTIRGGGVIFLIAIIISGVMYPQYWLPVFGAAIIGIISFIDDRVALSSKFRILFHLLAVTVLFYYLPIFGEFTALGIIGLYILVIGIINAYNFMDGINGMTGVYSLVVLCGFQYINLKQHFFVEPDAIWLLIISCLVFLFFNFRKKAKCFAGDVGSVTMAFWIMFLLFKLILETGDLKYILFLTVYGVDTVLTIIHRLFLRENIFDAHRLHFYQILANERGVSHLIVSSIYAVSQLIIIALVIFSDLGIVPLFLITVLPLTVIYFTKPGLMTKGFIKKR